MTNPDPAPIVARFRADLESIVQALYVVENRLEAMIARYDDEIAPLTLAGAGVPARVTLYNQRDPKWSSVKLGTSNVTIGGYGCLITCVASCLTDAGTVMNPPQLNAWLNANRGYTNGNRFTFLSVDGLNTIQFSSIADYANVPAPVAMFDKRVADGDFIIVKVDFDPATMQVEEHWVRYLGDGKMADPWHGDIAPIVPRYRGRDAAQAILRAAIYRRVSA